MSSTDTPLPVVGSGWGRHIPEAMIGKLIASWGARAIFQNHEIDLLYDRQTLTAKDDDLDAKKRIADWVNTKGLPFLRKECKRLYTDENRTIEMNDGSFHIEANPQSSYGYLYIRAWEEAKQIADISERCTCGIGDDLLSISRHAMNCPKRLNS